MKKSNWLSKGLLYLIFLCCSFLVVNTVYAQHLPGLAPVITPVGGMGIDGDAYANTPTAGTGDWFLYGASSTPPFPGTGGGVFDRNSEGEFPYPYTYFLPDVWGEKDPTTFLSSNKINDNPITYSIGEGNVPNKNEIQNAGLHFSYGDPDLGGDPEDLWCIFAADRQVNNGDSYIDFEFLQRRLELNESTMLMETDGLDGGRTEGDILVTVAFSQGGGLAGVYINEWTNVGGSFEYVPRALESFEDHIFVSENTVLTYVPFDAYGLDYYDVNQWVEGAINLTEILNLDENPCYSITSVFIRTRTSGESAQSELKDIPGAPIQVGLDLPELIAHCPGDVSFDACTPFAEIQAAYNEWKSEAAWYYEGGVEPVNEEISSFPDLPTNANCGFTATVTYTISDFCEQTDECSSTFTVAPDLIPPVLANLPTGGDLGCNPERPICDQAVEATDNCGTATVECNPGDVINDGCEYSQTVTYVATDECLNTASQTVTYTWTEDLVPPTLVDVPDDEDLGCNPTRPACLLITATDDCGTATVECNPGDVVNDGCEYSQTFTYVATDECLNTASQTVTYTWKEDLVPPQPMEELADITFECNVPIIVPEPVFMDNCDGEVPYDCEIVGYPDADCETFEFPVGTTEICYTAIDECQNPTTICINITVKPCEEFCTYTQGFYGSQKGTACNLEESLRGEAFTAGLIAQGDLTIGYGTNKVVFKSTYPTAVAKVIQIILPGGKSSYALSGTCEVVSNVPSCMNGYLTKQKTLNNQLFAQTLVLGLNMRINEGLTDVTLEAGKWLTTQEKLYCMEESGGVEMVCSPIVMGEEPYEFICNQMDVDPYWYYMLPEGVLCYMAENGYDMTIGGLYELANKALGGAETGMMCGDMKVTLDHIASAVDMINNAFDECRILVGNLDEKIMCPDQCPEVRSAIAYGLDKSELKVYPNPFTTVVNFEFVSAKDADARLEIYDMLGQKITTLLDQKVEKGVLNRIEFRPEVAPGMLIYRLTMDGNVTNGTMIFNKQ
ncbi:por secretion system C-terminal sorting domain [Bacteroidales bacterium 6E]|nr:por secretion system C-terminal sorting domain [Bacteroidales bacterium 6E]